MDFLYKLKNKKYEPIYLVILTVISSLIVYIPFYKDLSIIYRYWDGPHYLFIAKTVYNIPFNHPFYEFYQLPQSYFACHLPLYPLLIKLFSFLTYPVSMLFTTIVFSSLCTLMFYFLLKELNCVINPFFSSILAIFLPPRWLIYHSVGASEPLFLFLAFSSLYFFYKKNYILAFLLASLSSITRIIGVLFCFIYLVLLIEKKEYKYILFLPLILIPLFFTFVFYEYQFSNFWAYFSWNNKLLHPIPAEVFINYAYSGERHSAELYFLLYFILGLGTLLLWKYPILFTYSLILYYFHLFVFHEDISRYFLSITHFSLIVAYDKIFNTWQFKLIFILFLPFIYIYIWNLIPNNLCLEDNFYKLMHLLNN